MKTTLSQPFSRFLAMTLLPAALLLGTPACGDDDDDDGTGGTAGTSAGGNSAGGQAGTAGSAGSTAGTSSGTAGTSSGSSGTAGTAGTAGSGGSAGSATQAQSDGQLAGVLAAINTGEITQGELAATNALDADVGSYGTMMVTMHTDNQTTLNTLLQSKGLTLAESTESQTVTSKGQTVLTQLQAQPAKSAAFDMAYVQSQIAGHQDALALLDDVLLPKAQDADLKAHFTKTRADVVMHLEEAQALMSGNAGGAGGAGGMAGMSGAAGTAGGTAGTAGAGGTAGSGGTAGAGGTAGSGGGAPLEVGKACAAGADCPGGTCLSPESYPQGYCSKVCSGDVITEGDPCPSGAACVQVVEAAAVCLDLCTTQADCRPGYACRATDTKTNVCFPACQADTDCESLEKCDTASGLCVADPTKKAQPGDACTTSDACAGQDTPYCFNQQEFFPGGMCTSNCTEANVKQACSDLPNANCFAADLGAGTEYLCFGRCQNSVNCRDGYVCTADAGEEFRASDGTGACVPSCKTFDCGEGYQCDPTGVCVQAKAGVAFQVTHQNLGTINVSDTKASAVEFTLPENTLSFSLVANPLSNNVQAVIPVKVTTPNGSVYDYDNPLLTQFKTIGLSNAPYAALYPNTPRLNLPAGKYTFELAATDPTDLQVDVLFKQGSGVLSAGTMPMVFYFTAGSALTAAQAKTDATLQAAITKVKNSYAQIGITLTVDDASYIDLPDSSQYAVIDQRSELRGLFALANKFPDISGLNFFFIDQYAFPGGQGVLGVSGGIPGSPGLAGVTHAGVSVAYGLLADDPESLGIVMAHEGGHYLGLYHPTEATGQAFDPLDDTPECPRSTYDTNGDGRVDHLECADAGTSNMMFWLVDGPPNKTFSGDQQFVLMRNPLVSH